MLSAILLFAALHQQPQDVFEMCRIVAMGKRVGDPPHYFAGAVTGAGIWLGSVGDAVIVGAPEHNVPIDLWLWSGPARLPDGTATKPNMVRGRSDKWLFSPPITVEQRRQCQGIAVL